LHFGLAKAQVARRVTVRWPDGRTEEFANVAANQWIVIKQGSGIVKEHPFRR
jgi:hypothetical protein